MAIHDLHITQISHALTTRRLDLVVTGSIGAVESVRFARALRRLGADVYPWLSSGGAMFTTETALSWAAARAVRTKFEGDATHIATGDACIIAPASASFIAKLANGITDSPCSALVASYLGQKKPVLILPNMHDSLSESPMVADNLRKLAQFATILLPRQEEGKQKFPDPAQLADQIAHHLNQMNGRRILLTMGTTRGAIDDVRYISNYSSGGMGSRISEEFYRYGHRVLVVRGPCMATPRSYSELDNVVSNQEMADSVSKYLTSGIDGAIFAASVLDFIPQVKHSGKIKSNQELKVEFIPTPKIIAQVQKNLEFKVAFKLETDRDPIKRQNLAQEYIKKYQLSHLVYNEMSDVNESDHKAYIFSNNSQQAQAIDGKSAIASHLVKEAEKAFHDKSN